MVLPITALLRAYGMVGFLQLRYLYLLDVSYMKYIVELLKLAVWGEASAKTAGRSNFFIFMIFTFIFFFVLYPMEMRIHILPYLDIEKSDYFKENIYQLTFGGKKQDVFLKSWTVMTKLPRLISKILALIVEELF